MNTLIGVVTFLYMQCVRRFPSSFRHEFEEEMCDVFSSAMNDARNTGNIAFLMTIYREFRDFPRLLFSEHWQNIKDSTWKPFLRAFYGFQAGSDEEVHRRFGMTESVDTGNFDLHTKRLRILATLPVLLFGLGIAATSLTRGGPWHSVPSWRLILSVTIGLLPMVVIAIGGILAFLRRFPDWGLTWIGASFMGLLIFVKTVAEELAEVGKRIVSEPVEIGIVLLLFFVGVALLVFVGLRGWQRGGLLSIGFSVTFTLTFFWAVTAAPFYRHDLAVWAGPVSLMLAVLTYLYTQASTSSRVFILVGIGFLNVVSLLTINTIWTDWFQTQGRSSSALPFVIFMFLFLVCGPISGLVVKPIENKLRRA